MARIPPAVALYRTIYGICGDRAPATLTSSPTDSSIHHDRVRRLPHRPQPFPPSGCSHEHTIDRNGPSLGLGITFLGN